MIMRIPRLLLGVWLACSVAACDDAIDYTGSTDALDAENGDAGIDGDSSDLSDSDGSDGETIELTGAPPESGEYAMTIKFVDVSGVESRFKMDLTVDQSASLITKVTLAPINDDTLGDIIATVEDIPYDEDGVFNIQLPESTLPGAFSPTGSDIVFVANLRGANTEDGICGFVTGTLISVGNLAVTESTFGAAPYEGLTTPTPTSCGGVEVFECPRMDVADCPSFVSGDNTGFNSCGVDRTFTLVEPNLEGAEAGATHPLIFSWHGLGGGAAGYLSETGFNSNTGAFIIAPDGRGLAGTEYAQTTLDDNEDLAFFDDLVTCATAQLAVDENRIYSEGMSAGGLFTSYLAMLRPDVLAAATPFSGGLIISYPSPDPTIPVLASWGGEGDIAVGQNFNTFATEFIDDLVSSGHFVVACDHGEGHERKPEWTPYALQFMLDHPKGVGTSPYLTDGLPEVFPDFCTIRTASVE